MKKENKSAVIILAIIIALAFGSYYINTKQLNSILISLSGPSFEGVAIVWSPGSYPGLLGWLVEWHEEKLVWAC